MAVDALIFDLDGTLLDTNRLHVRAWELAFAAEGFPIGADRSAVESGQGVLGGARGPTTSRDDLARTIQRMEARLKEAAKLGFGRAIAPAAASDGAVLPIAGARRLADAVRRIGDNDWT